MELIKGNKIVGTQGQIDFTPANNHLYIKDDSNLYLPQEMSSFPATAGNTLIRNSTVRNYRINNTLYTYNFGSWYPTNLTRNVDYANVNLYPDWNSHCLFGELFYMNDGQFYFQGWFQPSFVLISVDPGTLDINRSPGTVYFNLAQIFRSSVNSISIIYDSSRYGIGTRQGSGSCFYACSFSISGTTLSAIPNVAGWPGFSGSGKTRICWCNPVPIVIRGKY